MNDIYDPNFVKKLFNKMSSSYERMNYITSFGFSIIWRKQFIKTLNRKRSKIKVLDLLSGLGENWSYLKNRFQMQNFML
ncbi:class I SAM-dependent methyltransferase [Empedobacter tilapiae]|uniref:class I SAM-dependent methyltransferase n=1 Tax=Empedobacter tilapiae TaxID=2491114 RepID=UPI002938DA69|nr:class I SAM-dependent methyltransferase [Empedobacter tilapiae]